MLMYPREGLSMGLEEGGGKAGSLASGLSFLQQVGAWQFSLNAWVSASVSWFSFSVTLFWGCFTLISLTHWECCVINGKDVLIFDPSQSEFIVACVSRKRYSYGRAM